MLSCCALFFVELRCVVPCVALCRTEMSCAVLYCAVLCCAVLCCRVVLCFCVVLRCVVPCVLLY